MSIRLHKYSAETVSREAQLYIDGYSIPQIANALKIPVSTVSWHLIHPLKEIDYWAWIEVRDKLLKRAKDPDRYRFEKSHIDHYPIVSIYPKIHI